MNIAKFMAGKKTYTALVIALIGVFGVAEVISPSQATIALDHAFELVGILWAVYGHIVTKK